MAGSASIKDGSIATLHEMPCGDYLPVRQGPDGAQELSGDFFCDACNLRYAVRREPGAVILLDRVASREHRYTSLMDALQAACALCGDAAAPCKRLLAATGHTLPDPPEV